MSKDRSRITPGKSYTIIRIYQELHQKFPNPISECVECMMLSILKLVDPFNLIFKIEVCFLERLSHCWLGTVVVVTG